ncbi:MAG: methylamine utilization protein MauE [Gemmatimonadetes bacterium]|nr:methylamine utilization protein MauE [Gemmatimonadota bacterium]
MEIALDPAVGWIVALSLGLLLGAAALHKLREPARFRSALAGYRILPEGALGLAGIVVIGTELGSTVLLVLPATRPLGGGLAATLLAGYGAAIALNLLRGRTRIDCGCLGFGTSERIAWWMVGRNGVLAAAALAVRLPSGARTLEGLDWLTVAGTVAAIAALFSAASRLASLPSLRSGAA